MNLLFLRHGESEYNLSGLCNADPAIPVALTAVGRYQAQTVAERLRGLAIQRVYVSRLRRAQETAAIVNVCHGADIHVDSRLDDRNTGFEGMPVSQYLEAMRGAPAPFDWNVPGGESYRELVARVHAFLVDMRGIPESENALVVTHHEVLQAVAGYFRQLALPDMWQVWVENCEILEFGDTRRC